VRPETFGEAVLTARPSDERSDPRQPLIDAIVRGDHHRARLLLAAAARPGDQLRYRTAPPLWEMHEGRVTAVLLGVDGRPVLVFDGRVAVAYDAWALEAGARCHRLGKKSYIPSVVTAVEGTPAAPVYRLRDVYSGQLLAAGWRPPRVAVLRDDAAANAA
jgi:hypothetical protein